ncbi:LPXTG cell wall anchor domain-containing protein [Streptomyces sp. NPDC091371]|uniref:LPXTG cell wall anchor domain-containing protein n=1 Tax=Streptomyces sp. NPDC091371 TaxID=3155303 RepID=UPI0034439072
MRTKIASPTVLTALAAVLGLMFLTPVAAHAHGDTVKVVVTGQREGRVTADITWENDGDAVEEAVAATVNATNPDGSRTLGPWRLVRDTGASRAAWTTAEALPPGSWKVTVDVGFPALGHGELEVAVPVVDPAPTTGTPAASTAPPAATTPAAPVTAPAPTPEPGTEDTGTDSGLWWTTAGVAVLALAGAATGILIRRRRRLRLR